MKRMTALSVLGLMVWASPLEQGASVISSGSGKAEAADRAIAASLSVSAGVAAGVRKTLILPFSGESRNSGARLADFIWRQPTSSPGFAIDETAQAPVTGDVMGHIHYVNPRIRAF